MTDECQTLTVPEVAATLGVGKTSVYEAIARGEIRALHVGTRVVVPKSVIAEMLSGGLVAGITDRPHPS